MRCRRTPVGLARRGKMVFDMSLVEDACGRSPSSGSPNTSRPSTFWLNLKSQANPCRKMTRLWSCASRTAALNSWSLAGSARFITACQWPCSTSKSVVRLARKILLANRIVAVKYLHPGARHRLTCKQIAAGNRRQQSSFAQPENICYLQTDLGKICDCLARIGRSGGFVRGSPGQIHPDTPKCPMLGNIRMLNLKQLIARKVVLAGASR